VYRIYRELELNLRIKPKKRLVREKPEPLSVPTSINQCWSMDFMHDQLAYSRRHYGPEYISSLLATWAISKGIELMFTQPVTLNKTPTLSATTEPCGMTG